MTVFHLERSETTHYALSRSQVEELLAYNRTETERADIRGNVADKTDAELAAELLRELDGDRGFEIVGELRYMDPDAEAVADKNEVTLT